MSEKGDNRIRLGDLIRNRIDEDTFEGKYNASIRRRVLFILSLIIISIALFFVSVGLGAVNISLKDTLKVFGQLILPDTIKVFCYLFLPSLMEMPSVHAADILLASRMPRVVLVIFTGFSLGVAGMIMQGLLRNPLVSPFTLGVSTAASFGAAMSIVFGSSIFGNLMYTVVTIGTVKFDIGDMITVLFAFVFAMLSIIIILMLTKGKNTSRSMVILSGVVISYLFQAGVMASKYISDDEQLREITLWIMGSMAGATWGIILILLPIVVICSILLFKVSMDVNALSAGDDVASNLGVNVSSLRKKSLVISTLMTSACLAFTGVIGFIGLMAPHICRMIIGNDSRYLMPAAGFMGVVILLISDLFCRLIIRPGELPVGIVMYVIGGIFFIWMISNRKWSQRI
ncbi:MAG: iron ABC transporter permease [Candidatus Methanoplasma sp.]|jgi:iron complex transport system permease protein|nr:iron ABC transporter permease [Candidatus Methanoplasma sp.]